MEGNKTTLVNMLAYSDDEDEEDLLPPPVSALPSFGSDAGIPFDSSDDKEPAWLEAAASDGSSHYATPRGTPMAPSREKEEDEEPAWLKQASARVSDIHLAVGVMLDGDTDESPPRGSSAAAGAARIDEHDLESGGSSSPSKSWPRKLPRGRHGSDAAAATTTTNEPNTSGGTAAEQAAAAFSRVYDAVSRAWTEMRELSAQELSDGLLGLSVGCTRSMRDSLALGMRESGHFAREVYVTVSSPEDSAAARVGEGESRLQAVGALLQARWRGLLQLPAAALYAIFALVHAVLAMLVTFLRHTPEATRQFYVYVRTSLIEYHEARLPGGQERVRGRREARKALLSHDEEEEA